MASAWSQLDQLLTCAICLDRYRNPKLLPCQHTFCMEPCLEGLIDYARRQIKCPECRAEHRIPYQGVQAFPTNVTLMRFLELHRDITGEEPEPPPSMMERCNVCSEKSYLEKCAHCEKKICQDCKEAHVDILRREINRINNQVRRGLHRLSEALTQTKKNAEKLQLNCTQVKDEIEDIVRRYSKDLRNTEDKLKHDLEIYTETELKAINKLKEDLEAEMTNMSSNCDLVDKHIKDDAEWSDAELLEYKEIFLKTLDFLRAFDADNSDFARRIKFQPRADPDVLHRNIADFGELKISAPSVPTQQSLAPPQSNALMRSQSDHRLAAQFARRQDNRSFADINQRYGSDTEREGRPTSPLFSRTSRRDTDTGYRRYSERSRDYDYQDRDVGRNRYIREENSSSSISSRWRDSEDYGYRSRYNRDYDDFESESQHTRTVRFADDPPQNQTQRERLLDMGDATKGPLSGIIRLMDSPKVMERLHQNEVRQKQQQNDKERKAQEPPATPQPAPPPPAPTTPAAPQPPPRRPPSRQQSEDDIDRQKKMNQQQAASSTTSATPATPAAQQTQNSTTTTTTNTEPQPRPISRRVTALQKEDETKASSPGDRGQRKDNRSPDVSESTASPRSDVTTQDECPEAPTRSRRQLSTTSSTETDLPESPSSPRASESPRRAESPRLLSRQVSREEVKLDSKDSPTPSWRSVGTRDTTPNREQSRLSRSPSGTIRDDISPYTTRRHAYTRHQSDTRFDRPVTNFGIGRQSPISEEHSSKSGYTGSQRPSSLVIGRSSPTRRISLEDYTGQERPDYNRFRTALSRTSSTSSMSLHSPTSPDDGARSPSAVTTRYSPLYRRNIAVPISGLEPTSNDESCSSDSSSSSRSSSSCSSSSSTSEYVDAVSRPSSVDNYSEAESPPSRCPRPTLGKAVSLDAESGSQPAKTPLDKKVPHQVDQQQKKSEEEEDDDDEEEEEEVLRPKQSSFYSRLTNNNHRRLPDPEPRLLQEPNDSSDEEEDDDDDDEEDDLADDKTLSVKQGDNAEESDSEVSSSSSSSSESEDSEESEETKVQNEPIPSVSTSTTSQRKDNHSSKVASTNNIPNQKTENSSETTSDDEDDDEDDAEENGDAIETSNKPNTDSTVRIRSAGAEETSSDGTSYGSRRKSDDADATDSSSSSSNQYQSLSHNSTPIVSNGNMAAEENLSSEGSSSATSSGSTSSHRREPRYSGYRRGPITRSKSSHELGLGTENVEDEEDSEPVIPTYRSRYDRMSEGSNTLSRSRSHHALKSNDHSPEETNTTAALSSSSNSSWAKYLRSKYGNNATNRVVPRSRSSHNLYSRSDSETSEDDGTSGRDSILSGTYGFSNPRSTYIQKRRMMLKIGARGTDASCFTWPRGVAVGPDNSIVVADSSNHRVQVFDAIGKFLHEFGTYGSAEGDFDCLAGVAVNRIGQFIVSDRYNHRVQLFDPTGRFLRSFGCEGRTDGRFNYPWGITTDSLGFIYVCDKENHRIQVFQSDGTFVGKFGSIGSRPGQLEHPHYIAVSNTNRVVVSDSNNHRIQIFDVNGRSLSTFGSEGSEDGQFKFPRGVAVDDQGYIIVGDSGNNRVQIFHPDGTFLRGFGNWGSGDGEFKGLEGIAVTSGGSILVCDRENHRIQVF